MNPLLLVLAALTAPGLAQFNAYRPRHGRFQQQQQQQQQQRPSLTELENTPFTLANGSPYRDMLTIGASRAVAQYAARFQPSERIKINAIRVDAERNPASSPKFYSATLNQPIGRPQYDTPDFSTSRRIRIPTDLQQDRVIADRDEATLTAEDRAPAANIDTINRPPNSNAFPGQQTGALTLERPRAISSSIPERTRFGAGRPSPSVGSSGNYQSVFQIGASYSSGNGESYNGGYNTASGSSYPTYATPPPPQADVKQLYQRVRTPARPVAVVHHAAQYVPVRQVQQQYQTVFLPLSSPVAAATASPTGSAPSDFGFNVQHGTSGGSYSYSTFG